MKKIKVLHLHTLAVISGSGINTLLTMSGLNQDKYQVEFACAPGGPLVERTLAAGIKFHPVRNFVQRISIYHDLRALIELVSLIRRQHYDIVHTHNSKAGFLGRLAAKMAGTRIIVHTIHGFAFHEYERPGRRELFIWLERFAARFTDRLITISRALKDWGLKLKIGRPEKYITIYSGIEIEKFQAKVDLGAKRRQFGLGPDDQVIGVVAKLWEGKGHRCILEAAPEVVKQCPRVKFMFVGEGYLRKDLEQLRDQLGLTEQVIFTGFRTDVPEVTAIFDLAVLASLFEGLGRVLLEAMACAKPVIASRVGGIVDLIDDRAEGILVPPGNSHALAEAMIRLLGNEQLRIKMGRAGRARIGAKFSARTMVRQIEDVYQELLGRL
ncbi:MAG: glycosyltransferase family 4 protein [Candidatus Omnitrophica bacterium]|nr:glycosyltransferase family 4 protein [Candidatus Omnitrophota bacterium]